MRRAHEDATLRGQKDQKRIKKGERNKMIYINGTKATKADIKRLLQDLKNGTQRATAHTTKSGNLAIVTEF
jgi:hypothetical protein